MRLESESVSALSAANVGVGVGVDDSVVVAVDIATSFSLSSVSPVLIEELKSLLLCLALVVRRLDVFALLMIVACKSPSLDDCFLSSCGDGRIGSVDIDDDDDDGDVGSLFAFLKTDLLPPTP